MYKRQAIPPTLVSQNLNSISKNLSIPDWFLLAYWRNPKADALASPFLSKNDGRALDGIWSWAAVRHPWPTRGGLIASSGLTRVAVRRCSSMLTVFETLWYACLAYTGFILYRRWVVYSRTRHFILEQRRKAVSYTHLTLPTICLTCRSRWSPYH